VGHFGIAPKPRLQDIPNVLQLIQRFLVDHRLQVIGKHSCHGIKKLIEFSLLTCREFKQYVSRMSAVQSAHPRLWRTGLNRFQLRNVNLRCCLEQHSDASVILPNMQPIALPGRKDFDNSTHTC
jgi:hypothetical protein